LDSGIEEKFNFDEDKKSRQMNYQEIHPDISRASTLAASFYRDISAFEATKQAIFAHSWHWAAEAGVVKEPGSFFPFTLLEGVLNEPLVLTHEADGKVHCLSNVCTHRGKIIAEQPGKGRQLRCGYHGRCFRLDGTFKSMPEFNGVENFPTEADNLAHIPLEQWLGLLFTAIDPKVPFEEMTRPIRERLRWLPLDSLEFSSEDAHDYYIDAHWALYCDNFLEGFHIPFVHPALNQAVDFSQYEYELFPYCNLQLAVAEEGEPHFDVPEGEKDYGRKVYAYYFWLFPNLMFNFYPWGLSLNVVEPLSHNRTRIRFRTYYFKDASKERKLNRIDQTEMEDEEVVISVQKGIQSRFYRQGRFSPKMEPCVHHFHRLVSEF
jgi:choline monooxygenase